VSEIQGFPPIADEQAELLILGSMPSKVSLAKQQYYGHPRNAFWPIMGALFGAYPHLDYSERKSILLRHRVALWDVLASCRRNGSADSGIVMDTIQINDLYLFFACHAAIGRVFFNGGAAEAVYNRYILPALQGRFDAIHYRRLPSTSPAFAGMTLQEKLDAWRIIVQDVG
jgi:TDG/mug DNA glycosylase family protein